MPLVQRPYTWKERLVDQMVKWINQVTGHTYELSYRKHLPYPTTLAEELDVLTKLHFALNLNRDNGGDTLLVKLTCSTVRPVFGPRLSQLTYPTESFVLPNKTVNVYTVLSHETRGLIPRREDKPGEYDFRHCPVTMRAWQEIKRQMPPTGTTTITLDDKHGRLSRFVSGDFFIGSYRIFRGRIEYSPEILSVVIVPQWHST